MKARQLLVACATARELAAFVSGLPGGGAFENADGGVQIAGQPGERTQEGGSGTRQCPGGAQPRSVPGLTDSLIRLTPRLHVRGLVCGIGPAASALALGRVLGALPNAFSGLIIAGLAGAYDPVAAPVGSLVLAEGECLPEYGIWPDAGEIIKGLTTRAGEPAPLPLAQTSADGREIFARLDMDPDAALGRMGLSCHSDSRKMTFRRGLCLSVAGVSGTPGRARRLAALFGGLVENMEGFSLALGAAQAGLPCLEVRAVSNEAGFRPPQTWDIPLALEALADAGRVLFAPWVQGSEALL